MKSAVACLCGVLLSSVAAGCWGSSASQPIAEQVAHTATPVRPTGPQPKAVADEVSYHFGKMKIGDTGRHTFVIRNEGAAPLELKKGRTTCKCTLSTLGREQVAPGESAEVELSWNIKAEQEIFRQEAEILTNDADSPTLKLTIEGDVVYLLVLTPTRVWTFTEVHEKEPTTLMGTLHSPLLEQFSLGEMSTSNPLFTISAEPLSAEKLTELDARSGYAIQVTLTPGLPVGEFHETGLIRTDADEGIDVPLEFVGQRRGPISVLGPKWSVEGNYLRLGAFGRDQGATATVSLFIERGPSDLEFTRIEADPEFLTVTLRKDPAFVATGNRERYVLTFSIPPGVPATQRDLENLARIRVETNHPEVPRIVFRVRFQAI